MDFFRRLQGWFNGNPNHQHDFDKHKLMLLLRYNDLLRLHKAGKVSKQEYVKGLEKTLETFFILTGVNGNNPKISAEFFPSEVLVQLFTANKQIDELLEKDSSTPLIALKNRLTRLSDYQITGVISDAHFKSEMKKIKNSLEQNFEFPKPTPLPKNDMEEEHKNRKTGTIIQRFELFKEVGENQELKDRVKKLTEQYNQLKREQNLGIVEMEYYIDQVNKIDLALLTMADEMG